MNAIEAWRILQWAALVLQAAVLVLAIRLYLIKRTQAFALLMVGCFCHVIMHTTWFTFNFAAGFFGASQSAIAKINSWAYSTSRIFHALFLIFMILALISFVRDRSTVATPSV